MSFSRRALLYGVSNILNLRLFASNILNFVERREPNFYLKYAFCSAFGAAAPLTQA